jgi:plasmid stabilization system protein ParE
LGKSQAAIGRFPMNYRLIIRPEAEFDLEDAFAWYELQETGLGSEFVRAIDNCISSIGRNPLAYRLIYQQSRRVLVRRFPYCLFYVVEGDTVFVIACFHTKRNPKDWQDRLS